MLVAILVVHTRLVLRVAVVSVLFCDDDVNVPCLAVKPHAEIAWTVGRVGEDVVRACVAEGRLVDADTDLVARIHCEGDPV